MALPKQNFFSINEAAQMVGVSADTLRRLEAKGKIKTFKGVGGKRLFSLDNIILLKELTKKSPSTKTYSIEEAALILNVSKDTLRRWEKEGKITAERTAGGHRRFTTEAIRLAKEAPPKTKTSGSIPVVISLAQKHSRLNFKFLTLTTLGSILIALAIFGGHKNYDNSSSKVLGIQAYTLSSFLNDVGCFLDRFINIFPCVEANTAENNVPQAGQNGQNGQPGQTRQVQPPNIFNQAITIADRSVEGIKIALGAITNGNLAGNAVTTDKILDNTITTSDLSSMLVFSNGDLIDLSGVNHKTTSKQGLILPNVSLSTMVNPISGQGYLAFDTPGKQLVFYNGTNWTPVTGGVTSFNSLAGGLTINGSGINSVSTSGSSITITANESDTLASVTSRGASTTTALSLGDLSTGNIFPSLTNTYNIGSSSLLEFNSIYARSIYQDGLALCDSGGNNCPSGAGLWLQSGGILHPTDNSVDVLFGGATNALAKFAFSGMSSGTPTASISGSTADVATFIDGNGNLGTTNAQDLTLGGTKTGQVILNSRGSVALTANGPDLTATGILTFPNLNSLTGRVGYLELAQGLSVGGDTTYYFDSFGNINANLGTFGAALIANGRFTANYIVDLGSAITDAINITGRIGQGSSIIPISTTGTNNLGSNSLPWDDVYSNNFVQNGNAVCDASGANCPSAVSGGSKWKLLSGAISPFSDSLDVLIGNSATTSAKFAFKNVLTGTPTASISGTVANVATFIDGNGNISTTNRNNLTLGNSAAYNTTGNVLLNPNGIGNVGIGTTNPLTTLEVKSTGSTPLKIYGGTATQDNQTNSGELLVGNDPTARGVLAFAWGTGTLYLDNSWNSDSGDIYLRTKTSGTPVNALVVKGSGNVGIGTTTPGAKLQIVQAGGGAGLNETIRISGGNDTNPLSGPSMSFYDNWDGSSTWKMGEIGMTYNGGNGGDFIIKSREGTLGSPVESLRIVGTTGEIQLPQGTPLTGVGSLYLGKATAPSTTFGNTSYLGVGYSNDNGINSYKNIGFGFMSPSVSPYYPAIIGYQETNVGGGAGWTNGDLVFGTRPTTDAVPATERMRITSGGNVGIGTTGPKDLLHLARDLGGATTGYWLNLENTSTAGSFTWGDWRIGHNGDNFAIFGGDTVGSPTTQLFTIGYAGDATLNASGSRLGIGMTPSYQLDIKSAAISGVTNDMIRLNINSSSDNTAGAIRFDDNNNNTYARIVGGFTSWGSDKGYLAFQTDNTGGTIAEKMRIDNVGNVGIGTISATALLDVNGNASVSGTLAFRAGTGTIQTTTFSNLVWGGTTTGNIVLSPSNDIAGGNISPHVTNVTDLGTSTLLFRNIYATNLFQGANQVCDAGGNNCPSGAGLWAQSNGALFPTNRSVDILFGATAGATATSSAKFAFTGINGGLPTASIAGNIANVATFIDGDGNISSTNRNNLTLGNSATYNSTGNILLNPNGTGNVGIGTTAPLGPLNILTNGINITFGSNGCASGYAFINFNSSPSCSNYSFLGDGSNTYLNAAGTTYLRSNNITVGEIASSGLFMANSSSLGWRDSNGSPRGVLTLWSDNNLYLDSTLGDFVIRTNGATERMRILNSGNIGIGTASPLATLDILGNLNEKGSATVSASYAGGIPLTVKIADSQAANLIEFKNSSGLVYSSFSPSSQWGFGEDAGNTVINAKVNFFNNTTDGVNMSVIGSYGYTGDLFKARGPEPGIRGDIFIVKGDTASVQQGRVGVGIIPTHMLDVSDRTDINNAIVDVSRIGAVVTPWNTSNTAAANGFGVGQSFAAETATDGVTQQLGMISGSWVDATNATRKAKLSFSAYDTAPRLGLEIEATGTVPKITTYGQTSVIGGSDVVQNIIKGYSSQTANLQEWQNSSGGILSNINAYGEYYNGATSRDVTNTPLINIQKTNVGGTLEQATYDITNTQSQAIGLYFTGFIHPTATDTVGRFAATLSESQLYGDGSITTAYNALYRTGMANFWTPEVKVIGSDLNTLSAGTVGSYYFLDIPTITQTGGTLTNDYGIRIGDVDKGTTLNYALYTNKGLNRLGDQLSIVGSADRQQLIVKANSTQTTNLAEFQNSTGTTLTSISGGGTLNINLPNSAAPHIVLGDSTGSHLDFFRPDVNGTSFVTPSYSNKYGQGDRSPIITITTSLTPAGPISALVNGSLANEFYTSSGESASGKYIKFQFGSRQVITEAKFYQEIPASTHGIWKWQGSIDNLNWVDIGNPFTFGGASPQIQTELSGNTSGYVYYRLFGVSGTTNQNGWPYLLEFEFKIGSVIGDSTLQAYTGGTNSDGPIQINPLGGSVSVGGPLYALSSLNTSGATTLANTLNVNLNGDGNVGIGTTSPAYRLDVSSTAMNLAGLRVTGGSSVTASNTADGQILIGGSTPYHGSIAYGYNSGYLYIDNTFNDNDGNIYFRTKTSATPVNALTILGNGNVGIGTTNPNVKLEILKDASNTINEVLRLSNPGTGTNVGSAMTFNAGGNEMSRIQGFWTGSSTAMSFHTGISGTERMRIDGSGNVGIGTTSPGNKLDVSDSSTSTASAIIRNTSSTAATVGLAIKMGATTIDNTTRFINFMDKDGNIIGKVQGNTASTVSYTGAGTDMAEYFTKDDPNAVFIPGTVMCQGPNGVLACETDSSSKIIGVVSDAPVFLGGTEGPDKVILALTGQVPVLMSPDSPKVNPGDLLTAGDNGLATKATKAGFVIGRAQNIWTPDMGNTTRVVVSNIWADPGLAVSANGNLNISADSQNPGYSKLTDSNGTTVSMLSGLTSLITNTFSAFQGTVDHLLVRVGLVSPEVLTREIKPITGENDIAIKIGEATASGKLLVKNSADKVVAGIDDTGNATFSGQINSQSASVSGSIHAGTIYADQIISKDAIFGATSTNTLGGTTTQQIEDLLNSIKQDQTLLNQSQSWSSNTATASAALNELDLKNLYVTGITALDSLSVTSGITVGSDLVITKVTNNTGSLTSIDTIDSPLSIQTSASQPLYIMAGKMTVDRSGNVQILGNLAVGGVLSASAISIAEDPNASVSGTPAAAFLDSQASAGQAKIASGSAEITIRNPNIKSGSLIFVTPTSPTQSSLYVKSKSDGAATVGFKDAVTDEVDFNWWIVNLVNGANPNP